MSIFSRIAGFFSRMIPVKDVESALDIEIATSQEMLAAQEEWRNAFFGTSYWNVEDRAVPSRRTAPQIAGEFGRVTVVEHESTVAGSPRADWLNAQYQPFIDQENFQNLVSKLAAGGELIWKPFPNSKGGFTISVYENNQYYPVEYNSEDELIRFITKKHVTHKDLYYTLLEDNYYNEVERKYTITYLAFKSDNPSVLGVPIPLSSVPEWEHLRDVYPYVDVSPWFIHVKMPTQNDIEQSNQNGVSIYSKALDAIRQLDEHGELTEHEFSKGRLIQEVTSDMIRERDQWGNWIIDKDLFVVFNGSGMPGEEMIRTYNPTPRIESYNQREQRLYREIEFLCQMSYGILSDAQQQAKTATEIHASLARFDNAVKSIQRTLQKAQRQLIAIMDEMTTVYYPAVPRGTWDMSFFWDDSVIASAKEKAEAYGAELTRLMAAVKEDLIKPEIVTAFMLENSDYLYKLTDSQIEEAKKYMPIDVIQTNAVVSADTQYPLEGDADG